MTHARVTAARAGAHVARTDSALADWRQRHEAGDGRGRPPDGSEHEHSVRLRSAIDQLYRRPGTEDRALAALVALAAAEKQVKGWIADEVDACRKQGLTWAEIGEALR